MTTFANIGYHTYIDADDILAIVPYKSKPVKALLQKRAQNDDLLKFTFGKPIRSVIITKRGKVITSFHETKSLIRRMKGIKTIDVGDEVDGDSREISTTENDD